MKHPPQSDNIADRLEALMRQHGISYAQLSAMLDKNPAYIQQFIKRGTPRKLDEEDRVKLGRYFGVSPEHFAPAGIANPPRRTLGDVSLRLGIIDVPRFDIRASAGSGAMSGDEGMVGAVGFDAKWLRNLGAIPAMLSIIRAHGDSMRPLICDGDDLLVDRSVAIQTAAAPKKSGIYVLRMDDGLMVKRVRLQDDQAPVPYKGAISIISENPEYPSWHDVNPAMVQLIGRVIWFGRSME